EHIMFRKVHLVDVKTGKATDLKNPGKMGQLSWSPDGKLLALNSGQDKHDPREGRLFVHQRGKDGWANRDGTGDKGHVESIAWQGPDWAIVQAAAGAASEVTAVKAVVGDGLPPAPRPLVRGQAPVLSHVSASRDGEALAFVGQTAKHPPEVY